MPTERPVKAEGPDEAELTDEELDKTKPLPLVVWAARCSAYFLAQGGIMLLSYAYYGFDTDPQSFPLGFHVSPVQAGINFAWGLAGTFIGFFRPRYAIAFVLAFAAFYTVVAGYGTFAGSALGMELGPEAQVFYWLLVATAWITGLHGLWRKRRPA
jgi:hypothetical protein